MSLTRFKFASLLAALAASACSGDSGFAGAGAKKSTKDKQDVATKTRTEDGISSDDGQSAETGAIVMDDAMSTRNAGAAATPVPVPVDPNNVPAPEWASLVDVNCAFTDMIDDNTAQIRCEMLRTDGQPIPDVDVPASVTLLGEDGQPRAGQAAQDAGPGAGLALTGGFGANHSPVSLRLHVQRRPHHNAQH